MSSNISQYKLKQSQKAKVRQFMAITGTDDHTAISCLTHNDWRLDMATDNFYQEPMKYYVEAPRAPVDKKKIESLFTKYRSEFTTCPLPCPRTHAGHHEFCHHLISLSPSPCD